MSNSSIPLGKIPEVVQKKVGNTILGFSTPLLGLKTSDPSEQPILLGSATFVQYGMKKGLLTAEHVISKTDFNKCLNIGLIITIGEHRYTIRREYLSARTTIPNTAEYGPDMAFIEIPEIDVGRIAARKAFWQIDSNRSKIPKLLSMRNYGMWVIFGCPSSYQRTVKSKSHFESTFIPKGLMSMASRPVLHTKNTYDYLDVRAVYDDTNQLPDTFGGVSGGGLWYVPLSTNIDDSAKIQVGHPSLMGIAFYETGVMSRCMDIRCHGPKSIYYKMGDILDNRAGDPTSMEE